MTRTPNTAKPVGCAACGILADPTELTDGTCTDMMSCMYRIRRRHRADALRDARDPFVAAHDRLDELRSALQEISDDMAAVQDAITTGRGRIFQSARSYDPEATLEIRNMVEAVIRSSQGEEVPTGTTWSRRVADRVIAALKRHPATPDAGLGIFDGRHDHDIVDDVARVLAPAMTDAGEDPYYSAQAKAAVLVTRGGPAAEQIMTVWQEHADPDQRQKAVWDTAESLYRKVAAGQIIEVARDRHPNYSMVAQHRCQEGRYDERGDCDGALHRAEVLRHQWAARPGDKVILCRSHYAQAVGDGEVRAGAPEVAS